MTNEEFESKFTQQQKQVYHALYKAAERMGENNYKEQSIKWLKTHKNLKKFRFTVTPEHETVVKAMSQVLKGEITPEQGMALFWEYDIQKQRGII